MNGPFLELHTFSDVEQLIAAKIPEDLHLDYKSGRPTNPNQFKDDIAKDVSAFANSDGGSIIIGVRELDDLPSEIDGVDVAKFSRESLGQVIASKVRPPVPGLRVSTLTGSNGTTVLVVNVPKSEQAPHQGPDHKYYRRYEYHNQPLAHHEIEDLRRRQIAVPPLVMISTATRGGILCLINVQNVGGFPALDIDFKFPPELVWPNKEMPRPLEIGIRHLGPSQSLKFRCLSFPELLKEGSAPAVFDVGVEYTHSLLQKRIAHTWTLDFEAYRSSMSILSDEQEDRQKAVKALEETQRQLAAIKACLEATLARFAGANGLDLSVYTLRNLRNILSGKGIEKLDPYRFSGVQSALAIDWEVAHRLEELFRKGPPTLDQLHAVEGMTPEILARLTETFEFASDDVAEA
ncbi:MAG: ATP-binding protein [Acidobacteriota bacterium]